MKLTSANVELPLGVEAAEELDLFQQGRVALLLLAIEHETVRLVESARGRGFESVRASELAALLPSASPSYALYRWEHSDEGQQRSVCVFIFCCPEGTPPPPWFWVAGEPL